MRFSPLQQFILLKCFEKGGRVERKWFREFYQMSEEAASEKYQESIITKSIERLIDRGFLIGFGKRTPDKWFLTQVALTARGKKSVREIIQKQQRQLPL